MRNAECISRTMRQTNKETTVKVRSISKAFFAFAWLLLKQAQDNRRRQWLRKTPRLFLCYRFLESAHKSKIFYKTKHSALLISTHQSISTFQLPSASDPAGYRHQKPQKFTTRTLLTYLKMPPTNNTNYFQVLSSRIQNPLWSSAADKAAEEVEKPAHDESASSSPPTTQSAADKDIDNWVAVEDKKSKPKPEQLQRKKTAPKPKVNNGAAIKPFPSAPENVRYPPLTAEGLNAWFQQNPKMEWCYENKDAILALHSRPQGSKTFPRQCKDCKRFYQNCLFASWDSTCCKWCNTAKGMGCWDDQFDIHRHIHCYKLGPKVCGQHMELAPPQGLNAIRHDGLEIIIKKKMSQAERKREERETKQALGSLEE